MRITADIQHGVARRARRQQTCWNEVRIKGQRCSSTVRRSVRACTPPAITYLCESAGVATTISRVRRYLRVGDGNATPSRLCGISRRRSINGYHHGTLRGARYNSLPSEKVSHLLFFFTLKCCRYSLM